MYAWMVRACLNFVELLPRKIVRPRQHSNEVDLENVTEK
jgi:hypothetical protein